MALPQLYLFPPHQFTSSAMMNDLHYISSNNAPDFYLPIQCLIFSSLSLSVPLPPNSAPILPGYLAQASPSPPSQSSLPCSSPHPPFPAPSPFSATLPPYLSLTSFILLHSLALDFSASSFPSLPAVSCSYWGLLHTLFSGPIPSDAKPQHSSTARPGRL